MMRETSDAFSAKNIVRLLPLCAVIVMLILFLFYGHDVTAGNIAEFSPENPLLGAVFLLSLYALKSLSIFFPLVVLYLAGGLMFSPALAVFVNLCGVAVSASLPYWIARLSKGAPIAQNLTEKYPAIRRFVDGQKSNEWFFVYMVRLVGFLPGDVVSMYVGASGIRYLPYISATLLGMAPGIVAVTLVGVNITNPRSVEFALSVASSLLLSAASLLLYRQMGKKRRTEKEENGR